MAFKWYSMDDECPEFGNGNYLLMGKRGALYVADEFRENGLRPYFHIPNNRSQFLYAENVKAWAEIPPYGEVDR